MELTDAGAAHACSSCGGLWVAEAVLAEMILEMLPPGLLSRLQLAVLRRAEQAIACPTCGERMEQSEIHQVPIDRCPKHGVWFDRDELEQTLYRVSQHGIPAAPIIENEDPVPMPSATETRAPTHIDDHVAPTQPTNPSSDDAAWATRLIPTATTATETERPTWSDDPRMNDRQGLGLGPLPLGEKE